MSGNIVKLFSLEDIVKHHVHMYVDQFADEQISKRSAMCESLLKSFHTANGLSSEEIKDLAEFITTGPAEIKSGASWPVKLNGLTDDQLFHLFRKVEENIYSSESEVSTRTALTPVGKSIQLDFLHTDYYFKSVSNCPILKLPFLSSKYPAVKCGVCDERFIEKSFIYELKCGHIYHRSCLKEYFKRVGLLCPDCKSEPTKSIDHVFDYRVQVLCGLKHVDIKLTTRPANKGMNK
ncbi:hypothetical protein HELRODRAFT_166522 [Helobdella robusta]|uniref:RING-type domain-containing protein n=1 Tax=Helobdella robusta TaxID=6412 RepID=T1EY74_HELRO|nr:hypothetical protein HELRODRAFT_166522 [Helobdella robusta]ESO11522.1 hypothetical protein HELRODRAFT_166522 [Helobdella robusta]